MHGRNMKFMKLENFSSSYAVFPFSFVAGISFALVRLDRSFKFLFVCNGYAILIVTWVYRIFFNYIDDSHICL